MSTIMRASGLAAVLLVGAMTVRMGGQAPPGIPNWPSFRGTGAAGVADGYPLATEWDAPTSKNILWKTPIPGLGHSSPIIWAGRLYVSTAISGEARPELKVGLYGDIESVQDAT